MNFDIWKQRKPSLHHEFSKELTDDDENRMEPAYSVHHFHCLITSFPTMNISSSRPKTIHMCRSTIKVGGVLQGGEAHCNITGKLIDNIHSPFDATVRAFGNNNVAACPVHPYYHYWKRAWKERTTSCSVMVRGAPMMV